ncbi:MAG: hypothetical protein KC978_21280 [Candidatus Omnitrophica bacterium]|nr:hypothetical protein [Candidatus Omnitrophota bacterium]
MKRGRPPKCPYCGSSKSLSKGYRYTATMGARPLRKCKGCGRKYTFSSRKKSAQAAKRKKSLILKSLFA